jgi:hypothetical protein
MTTSKGLLNRKAGAPVNIWGTKRAAPEDSVKALNRYIKRHQIENSAP